MEDADAGRETDLVSHSHPFARVFHSDVWGTILPVVALGLMALTFWEHEYYMADIDNPPFHWHVGLIEIVLLGMCGIDQYMRAVSEMFVRPCNDRRRAWSHFSALCCSTPSDLGEASHDVDNGYHPLEEGLLSSRGNRTPTGMQSQSL